ncbi:MAG: NAD(P)-dependent oxidoreductase [Cellvibrionales bacterium]|nr:MAG: NAD(P)-dependent oxidoreductase [Cellvibrionales bacterium]
MNILIAGCGDVGTRLALRLINDGHEVWGIRRDVSALDAAIRGIVADFSNVGGIPKLPANLDYIVYCPAAGCREEAVYRQTYVDGLRNLLRQLRRQSSKVKRIIFTSSTAVYHQVGGEWVDENSATEPTGFSGRILLEAESLLANSGFTYSIVRFAGIYGPGRDHFINQVKRGEVATCTSIPCYTNRIHSDDCAGLLRHLIISSSSERLYIGVDSDPAPRAEVASWLAAAMNIDKPISGGESSSPRGQNKRCSNTKICEAGYEFLYPSYREGYGCELRRIDSVS